MAWPTLRHDHGIVHRDLKPANLFMERKESSRLAISPGLAKLITPSQGTDHSESIGTCHYGMAPEIGSGKYHKPIDVYAIMALSCTRMLTGKVPFLSGETVNEVLMKHLTARPDVSMLPDACSRRSSPEPLRQGSQPSPRPDLRHAAPRGRSRDHPMRASSATASWQHGARGQQRAKAAAAKGADQDDVLRNEAEEPIFYHPGWTPVLRELLECRRDRRADPGQLASASTSGSLTKAAGRAESATASRGSSDSSRRGAKCPGSPGVGRAAPAAARARPRTAPRAQRPGPHR